jgi:hypothetical protein
VADVVEAADECHGRISVAALGHGAVEDGDEGY